MSRNDKTIRHQICQKQDVSSATTTSSDTSSEFTSHSSHNIKSPEVKSLLDSGSKSLCYDSLYENNPSISLCLDLTGDILSINQFGAVRLGYVPEDLIGKSIFKLFAASEQGRLASLIGKILQKSCTISNKVWEFCLNCPASDVVWVNINANLVDIESSQTVIIMVLENITPYKKVDNKLIRTEHFSLTTANSLPAMIWFAGENGDYRFINKELADFLGIGKLNDSIYFTSSSDRNNKVEILNFIHIEDREIYDKKFKNALEKQQKFCCEYRLKRRDGQYRWILNTGIPQIDSQGTFIGYTGLYLDITEIRNSQIVLEERHDILTHLELKKIELEKTKNFNRLKDEFLSTVSHELRTPLTNMKMAIQMLGISLHKQNEQTSNTACRNIHSSKIERYFQILNNECEREINLINNFLDIQRLDNSADDLVLETIIIDKWLVETVELFKARDGFKRDPRGHQESWVYNYRNCYQQHLYLDISPHLPNVVCDRFSLERIVIELLTNAFKFSPPGERITLRAISKHKTVEIQTINTGVEIPPAELPKIFDKFYRIPSNDPWKQGGTGLGLALVKKLTHYLGGTVAVESKSNTTCFTIGIPHANSC
ncbi:MAG: ATP-binding protein [Mastigocoleus sp.]